MGWEYDGDEDAFNKFCNSHSQDDFIDHSDNEISGIESPFINTLLLHIISLEWDGQKGLNNLYRLDHLNVEFSQHVQFVRTSANVLFYDSNGDRIEHYGEYNSAIKNEIIKEKRKQCLFNRSLVIKKFLEERNAILKRKMQYIEEIDDRDPIEQIDNNFRFSYEFHGFLLQNEPSQAVEILSLVYGNSFWASEWNSERHYEGHIIKNVNELTLIEKLIERVATKLNLEDHITINDDYLHGNFEDDSSFEISRIYRPHRFGLIDYYELEQEIKYILESFNHHNLWLEREAQLTITEYLKSLELDNKFAKELLYVLLEDITISISIPTKCIAGISDFKDYIDDGNIIPDKLNFTFTMNRCPIVKKNRLKNFKEKIMESKRTHSLDILLEEGNKLLNV